MKKRLVLVLALASMLGGCVVVPARPAYYRPAPNYYYYPRLPRPHYYYRHGY